MLLRPDGDAVVAIGQASHAWLSGQLARGWGGDRFPAPRPWEEVCLGAEQHDVGMALWDLAPERNPATGLPLQFHELPRATHVGLWAQAPARMLAQSRYAALLVSLHGTGLYERFPPRGLSADDQAQVDAYLEAQRALQERLVGELGADREELARNRALVAAWDVLSLALCLRWAPHDVPGVPSRDGPVTLHLTADGDAHVLDPWPFAAGELEVRCEGRRLAGRFDSAPALHAALEAAPRVDLVFPLRQSD